MPPRTIAPGQLPPWMIAPVQYPTRKITPNIIAPRIIAPQIIGRRAVAPKIVDPGKFPPEQLPLKKIVFWMICRLYNYPTDNWPHGKLHSSKIVQG